MSHYHDDEKCKKTTKTVTDLLSKHDYYPVHHRGEFVKFFFKLKVFLQSLFIQVRNQKRFLVPLTPQFI